MVGPMFEMSPNTIYLFAVMVTLKKADEWKMYFQVLKTFFNLNKYGLQIISVLKGFTQVCL